MPRKCRTLAPPFPAIAPRQTSTNGPGFINGLPLATFELKNSLTKQTVADAIEQYRRDRDPRERLFEFGRCAVHFAVDDAEVRMCTELRGKASWFLPFNKGWNDGAGNPPNPEGLKPCPSSPCRARSSPSSRPRSRLLTCAGDVDDVADAAHRILQHVVGMREGLVLRDVVAQHLQQLLVGHDASCGSEELSGSRRLSVRATLLAVGCCRPRRVVRRRRLAGRLHGRRAVKASCCDRTAHRRAPATTPKTYRGPGAVPTPWHRAAPDRPRPGQVQSGRQESGADGGRPPHQV